MGKHTDSSDAQHNQSRTYGGNKYEAAIKSMEPQVVADGKVLPNTTPHKPI